jgi:hypothetical protein
MFSHGNPFYQKGRISMHTDRERGGGGDDRSSTASYDSFRLSPAASVALSLPLQQQQQLLLLLLLHSALVDCCMFNCALSAVAPHRPLSSTPPLSAISPLSSAVVIIRHRYCPHPPPSTAVRRRQHHCRLRPPSSTPLIPSTVPHPLSLSTSALCCLRPPSSVLVIRRPRRPRMEAMMTPALAVFGKGGWQQRRWQRGLSAVAVMGWRLHHPSLLSAFTTVLIAWSAVGKPNGVCKGREGRQGMLGAATTAGGTDNRQQSTKSNSGRISAETVARRRRQRRRQQ